MPKVRWVIWYGFCRKFHTLSSSAKIWKIGQDLTKLQVGVFLRHSVVKDARAYVRCGIGTTKSLLLLYTLCHLSNFHVLSPVITGFQILLSLSDGEVKCAKRTAQPQLQHQTETSQLYANSNMSDYISYTLRRRNYCSSLNVLPVVYRPTINSLQYSLRRHLNLTSSPHGPACTTTDRISMVCVCVVSDFCSSSTIYVSPRRDDNEMQRCKCLTVVYDIACSLDCWSYSAVADAYQATSKRFGHACNLN